MGTPTTAMHKLLLLVAGVSCAPQQQASRPRAFGPQGAAARYEEVPVYREEMAKNYPREEISVYREQEKPLEKRQAAYGPADVAAPTFPIRVRCERRLQRERVRQDGDTERPGPGARQLQGEPPRWSGSDCHLPR